MSSRFYTFVGGSTGRWRVHEINTIAGPGMELASRVEIVNDNLTQLPPQATWAYRGVVSNQRYTNQSELESLKAIQPPLGRKEATFAVLIPLTKSAAWWDLAQDERRSIIDERSTHIATGLRYLPAIARRLHHSRDLGEPFDFVTWFEFAPSDSSRFDELVAALRETEEWRYVEREIEVRLILDPI